MKSLWLAVFFCLLAALIFSGVRLPISTRITQQECQPETLKYDAFTYCTGIVKKTFLLYDTCSIHVVKKNDDLKTGYGLYLDAPTGCNFPTSFSWDEKGIQVSYATTEGENPLNLIIPAVSFTGGR